MIITAQPFFNELDLLELKLLELKGAVDAHLIVESTRTFTGIEKPLHFHENRQRFEALGVPILHYVCDLPAEAKSPWDREAIQYDAVRTAVREIRPDVVIWCDADEIPRPLAIERFLVHQKDRPIATLVMDQLLFSFLYVDGSVRGWTNTKIARYDAGAPEQPWRGTIAPEIPDGGWHCEYFGGQSELLAKLVAVSHAPEPGCQNMKRLVEKGERPGMERAQCYPFALLPAVVRADRQKWARHFDY